MLLFFYSCVIVPFCPLADEMVAVEQNLSAEEYQLRQQHQSGHQNGRPRTLSISPSLQLHQQQFLDHQQQHMRRQGWVDLVQDDECNTSRGVAIPLFTRSEG